MPRWQPGPWRQRRSGAKDSVRRRPGSSEAAVASRAWLHFYILHLLSDAEAEQRLSRSGRNRRQQRMHVHYLIISVLLMQCVAGGTCCMPSDRDCARNPLTAAAALTLPPPEHPPHWAAHRRSLAAKQAPAAPRAAPPARAPKGRAPLLLLPAAAARAQACPASLPGACWLQYRTPRTEQATPDDPPLPEEQAAARQALRAACACGCRPSLHIKVPMNHAIFCLQMLAPNTGRLTFGSQAPLPVLVGSNTTAADVSPHGAPYSRCNPAHPRVPPATRARARAPRTARPLTARGWRRRHVRALGGGGRPWRLCGRGRARQDQPAGRGIGWRLLDARLGRLKRRRPPVGPCSDAAALRHGGLRPAHDPRVQLCRMAPRASATGTWGCLGDAGVW